MLSQGYSMYVHNIVILHNIVYQPHENINFSHVVPSKTKDPPPQDHILLF